MSQSVELYDRFIRNVAKGAMERRAIAEALKEKPKSDGLLHVSELNRRIQELIGQYVMLTEYYLNESVHKVTVIPLANQW